MMEMQHDERLARRVQAAEDRKRPRANAKDERDAVRPRAMQQDDVENEQSREGCVLASREAAVKEDTSCMRIQKMSESWHEEFVKRLSGEEHVLKVTANVDGIAKPTTWLSNEPRIRKG